MTSFEVKEPSIMLVLLACSLVFYAIGIIYFIALCTKPFMPSHSAFTFPLVISAIATKMGANYFKELTWLPTLCNVQTVIAALVVLWVLVGYFKFLFSAKN